MTDAVKVNLFFDRGPAATTLQRDELPLFRRPRLIHPVTVPRSVTKMDLESLCLHFGVLSIEDIPCSGLKYPVLSCELRRT